jgi:hypothetical protein
LGHFQMSDQHEEIQQEFMKIVHRKQAKIEEEKERERRIKEEKETLEDEALDRQLESSLSLAYVSTTLITI